MADTDAWSALLQACSKEEPIAPAGGNGGVPPPAPHPRALSGGLGQGIPGARAAHNPVRVRRASSGSESDGGSMMSLEEQIPRLGFTVIFMPNGDKGYRCPEPGCMKVCSRLPDCKKHQRTHGDERPFPCRKPNCKKRFKDTSTRCKHERTHEVHAFPCPFCKRTYTRKDNLAAHKKQKHPNAVLGSDSADDIEEVEERPHERPMPPSIVLSASSSSSSSSSPSSPTLSEKSPEFSTAVATVASTLAAAVVSSPTATRSGGPVKAEPGDGQPAPKPVMMSNNYIGVTLCAGGFRAHLFSNGFKNDLGLFQTENEAATAHDTAARKIPGKRLNFANPGASTAPAPPRPLVGTAAV